MGSAVPTHNVRVQRRIGQLADPPNPLDVQRRLGLPSCEPYEGWRAFPKGNGRFGFSGFRRRVTKRGDARDASVVVVVVLSRPCRDVSRSRSDQLLGKTKHSRAALRQPPRPPRCPLTRFRLLLARTRLVNTRATVNDPDAQSRREDPLVDLRMKSSQAPSRARGLLLSRRASRERKSDESAEAAALHDTNNAATRARRQVYAQNRRTVGQRSLRFPRGFSTATLLVRSSRWRIDE